MLDVVAGVPACWASAAGGALAAGLEGPTVDSGVVEEVAEADASLELAAVSPVPEELGEPELSPEVSPSALGV